MIMMKLWFASFCKRAHETAPPPIHTIPKNTYGSSNALVLLSRNGRASWNLSTPEGMEHARLCAGPCLTKQ